MLLVGCNKKEEKKKYTEDAFCDLVSNRQFTWIDAHKNSPQLMKPLKT